MSFQIKGTLHKKFDIENKTESFQAREFVIKTDGDYPQFIKFQLVQDRCSQIDQSNEGDEINVHFDLRGREWNDKFFTNLNAWRVENLASGASEPVQTNPIENATANAGSSKDDDLPF